MRFWPLSLVLIAVLVSAAPAGRGPLSDGDADAILDGDDGWSATSLTLRDVTAYWDNDGTIPTLIENTDRFYTNGLGIEVSLDPNLNADLSEKLAPAGKWEDPSFGVGLALKQLIFTSENITDPMPPLDDHPYGGYLYLVFSFQRADARKHDHFELNLGVVGEKSQAEAIQKFIHNTVPNEEDPQGWGTQLANEIGFNLSYERTWKSERADIAGLKFEALPSIGFDAGNVWTRARAKMTIRAGLGLPDDFGPATLLGKKDHTAAGAYWGQGTWSFYGYASLGVDAVARNIFLDGNTFADSRSVDSEPFVAQWTVGAVVRYRWLYLGWSQTFQTETFEAQPDRQTWGSIVLGASFNF